MSDEKIIRFPGGAAKPPVKPAKPADAPADPAAGGAPGLDGLNEDQRKAIGIVISGMPFVLVGIKATTSGADFFTAIGGDATDLRNARDHLAAVIERAYDRKGL